MQKIVLIVAVIIFVVAAFITVKVTKTIFNKVAGDITQKVTDSITSDITKSITGGGSLTKIEKKECNLPKTKRVFKSEPYYSGVLIDSHVHFPTSSKIVSSVAKQNGLELPSLEGDLAAENLICIFDSEGITKTFAFHLTSQFAESSAISTAKEIEKVYPKKLVHFLMPPPVKSLNVSSAGIKDILEENKDLFKGFGEVALYMDGFEGMRPNDQPLKEIYKLADEHKLVVMVHPEDNLKDGVEEILREFPNVTFFFHGGKHQEWIINLMPKYKNFYYSVDGDLVGLYGYKKGQEFKRHSSKEEFLSYLKSDFDSLLDQAVKDWKARIEAYPDRLTWGTDRWYSWHFDPEVGGLIEEFGRSFIGRLDPQVQEKFAYKNAEEMLK